MADSQHTYEAIYMYPTIEEYEAIVGFKVNDAFRIAWDMARLRSAMFDNNEDEEEEVYLDDDLTWRKK